MLSTASSVAGLDRPDGPTAIAWLVIAVIVDAVYRHAFRARPHVFEEVHEAMAPAITNRDSSATPIWKVWGSGSIASLEHRVPRLPCGRFGETMGDVPLTNSRRSFAHQTTATLGIVTFQITSRCISVIAAIADATPMNLAIRAAFSDFFNDKKPRKALPNEVKFGRHMNHYTVMLKQMAAMDLLPMEETGTVEGVEVRLLTALHT